MSVESLYLTFDLGAESGRALLGRHAEGKIVLDEAHRFKNEPLRLLGRTHWNTLGLFVEIEHGIAKAVKGHGGSIRSLGVDTWGVDFALLDRDDELLGLPYHYRDPRTDGVMEKTFEIVPRERIYQITGVQFMKLNTLFQLMALRLKDSPLLDITHSLLAMPDLINFWLTGRKANERTIATTTQCYDAHAGTWAAGLLTELGIPASIFGEIVDPGTSLGPLHASVRNATGAHTIEVIAPATHDTGSAVAAVPAEGGDGWAYISCGTWSLVGVETPAPVISEETLAFNLTNEGGYGGTTRLLRNVMGLWLLQRCRHSWERHGSFFSYEQLSGMAARALPNRSLIDPDRQAFLDPEDMVAAIEEACRETGQPAPSDVPSMVRCIVDSLAHKYRWVIERLEEVTGRKIEVIHLIGGGSQNEILCQATADATGRTVVAGPVEATALGNVLVQMIVTGALSSIGEGRALIRKSFELKTYSPKNHERWQRPYERFLSLLPS